MSPNYKMLRKPPKNNSVAVVAEAFYLTSNNKEYDDLRTTELCNIARTVKWNELRKIVL